MLKNFLKIAFRNLWKHKAFSLINITGLAIGIAAFLLILQYVLFERSFDLFHQKGERIYRLQQDRYNNGKLTTQWAAGSAGIGNAIKEFPEVEASARLRPDEPVMSYGDKKFHQERAYFATDPFLPMFSYKLVKGKAEGALKDVYTAVITESAAKKYFGNEDPMGKLLKRNGKDSYKITAVAADMPANTHFKFEILLSMASFIKEFGEDDAERSFFWDGYYSYILLKPGTDAKALEKKIPALVDKKAGQELRENKEGIVYKLQPLRDIHLQSALMYEAEANGNGQSVYFLLVIAVFIIVIAWINYINLSTARAIDRAREVGIRKVLGSYRLQLIFQFIFESLLINLLAVTLGFVLVLLSLPLFNSLTGKALSFSLLAAPWFWLSLLGLFAGGTLLAGLYPAFVMSSFKPVTVLKGKFARSRRGALLRQGLVIVQFAASVVLTVGTFGVYRQLSFMQSQDLGVSIDRTLVIKGAQVLDTATFRHKLTAFKEELLRVPGISKVAVSTEVPGRKVGWNAGGIKLVGSGPGGGNQYRVIGIDYDFLDAYGLKMLSGRNFSKQFPADKKTVLFNEAAVKTVGFRSNSEIINKRIEFWGQEYTVIGVVSNHHQESLKEAYDAHIYRLLPVNNSYVSLKLAPGGNTGNILKAAEAQWNKFFPGNPFDHFFLDDHYREQYKADQQFEKTFGLFAALAILVACLGLLGLSSFATTQRTKEIGIRKISGAPIAGLLVLLTRDFIKPVLLSFVIALPLTWYLLSLWLQNYAFRISMSPWLFVLPVLLITLIAIVTISTQTLKAATGNPVKSLRTE